MHETAQTADAPIDSAEPASSPLITVEIDAPVATITLRDEAKRNALSLDMMRALIDAFTELGERREVRAVILASTGKVFCAGHDLAEIHGGDLTAQTQIFDTCTQFMLLMHSIPQPVIAQVQGLATAAGCQLVATCDLAVASEVATFATPGVRIGLFCSTPMVALTRAVDQKTAMRMLLTGEPISAEAALTHGLVSHLAPAYGLADAARELAHTVASASAATVSLGKRAFYEQSSLSTADAYAQMSAVMANNAVEADAQEGICAFLDKRPAVWQHGDSGSAQ